MPFFQAVYGTGAKPSDGSGATLALGKIRASLHPEQ
jgi:hypothetical protein